MPRPRSHHSPIRRAAVLVACLLALVLSAVPAFADPVPPAEGPTALGVQEAQVHASDGMLGWLFAAVALLAGAVAVMVWRRERAPRTTNRLPVTPARRAVIAPRPGPRRPYAAPALIQSAVLETRAGSPFDPGGQSEDPLGLP